VFRIAASILGASLLFFGCRVAGSAPRAVDGRLDLSAWNFESDGDVALVGTWQICWNRLLEPGEACPSKWRPVPVRGLWSERSVGSPFGGKGVATYRLTIQLPREDVQLSLVAGGSLTAHRLFIDGVERGGAGIVGRTADTTVPGVFNRVYELRPGSDEIELQVQVANFVFRGGGLRRIWFLGGSESIARGVGHAILREGTLFVVGVVVGLGFLTLFALRPSERARGYFGMMSLVLGLRAIPASISNFGVLMAPWMSWGFTVRAEYLGMALAFIAAVGYARTKVAGIFPPRTARGLQVFGLAFALVVSFVPMPIVLATLPLQWLLPMILIGLVLVFYGRASIRGVPGAWITTLTAALYVGFVVHDILRTIDSGVGAPVELFPYAIVLWIFAEAYQLLQGLQESYERIESLSDELSDANYELQETEAAIVRFVPFDFLQTLGKESIRDVHSGDHAGARMSVLHCGFHPADRFGDSDGEGLGTDFDRLGAWVGSLEPCIHRNDGFLNDYRDDGFQAFFPGGPSAAIEAAVEILAAANASSGDERADERGAIDLGIGIDTGWVELGTLGTGEYLVRAVVGEPIDRARQIEALTIGSEYRLLISEATRQGIDESFAFEFQAVGDVACDGSGEALNVYAVRIP